MVVRRNWSESKKNKNMFSFYLVSGGWQLAVPLKVQGVQEQEPEEGVVGIGAI